MVVGLLAGHRLAGFVWLSLQPVACCPFLSFFALQAGHFAGMLVVSISLFLLFLWQKASFSSPPLPWRDWSHSSLRLLETFALFHFRRDGF